MKFTVLHIPPLGFLSGGRVEFATTSDDLHRWYVIKLIQPTFSLSEQSYSLYSTLRDLKKPRNNSFRILIIDKQSYWEMVPIWQSGILTKFQRRNIPIKFAEELLIEKSFNRHE
jgi:hypothetical protein